MKKTVGIGVQDFEKLRLGNIFYVDKTDFIRQWWESGDDVTLITRPRRFGKTLNISMLEKFFSVQYAERGELFEGLRIWEREKFRKLQGTWPVISLSFANVKERSFSATVQKICQCISDVYNDHRYLLDSDLLSEEEKAFFEDISPAMPEVTATWALHRLSKFLYYYYGKKVLILLDEYDTPMQEAYLHGYWEDLVSFTRSMFNSTFKTNPCLERAMMTGITRVSKESIFSDLNNLEVVTTTSEKYEDCFGFTEEEVFAALEEYGLASRKQQVKSWYDGFTFGRQRDMYNPWSIIHYLDKKQIGTYWANSSSNSLAGKLVQEGSRQIKEDFEELLRGGTLRLEIDEQIVYNQLPVKHNAVWSLLLASGYLKVVGKEFVERTGRWYHTLALTNREVSLMFETMIRDWFAESDGSYNDFIKALLLGDTDAMNDYMNRVALATFSSFDSGTQPSLAEPERFYHGFVLGLMVELADRYILTSSRESGFGRYDVMIEPLNPRQDDGIILEFKVFQPKKETELSDTVAAALKQINEKQYETALTTKGIPRERIRKYGFAFRGKEVMIGEGE